MICYQSQVMEGSSGREAVGTEEGMKDEGLSAPALSVCGRSAFELTENRVWLSFRVISLTQSSFWMHLVSEEANKGMLLCYLLGR